MKSKLFIQALVFSILIGLAGALFYITNSTANLESNRGDDLVAVNEIKTLIGSGNTQTALQRLDELDSQLRNLDVETSTNYSIAWICLIAAGFIFMNAAYTYFAILRPFSKLEKYASQLAAGNFDIPLDYERKNYFGKFTWAFDSMRSEITKARQCEKEAVENNKTVIATLSHDIKTPIASIRAYAEGLQANMDSTPEKREKYISVIMRKCDEVSKLTNDLFLHSISDLDKMKVNAEVFEICGFAESVVNEIAGEYGDVRFEKPGFTALVSADKNRLTQIIENLINNSRKYAKTEIDIKLTRENGYVSIHFTDYGKGIPDSDMPFIFDKFYRGKNAGSEQGSGLGLYIVKYLAEKMGGSVILHNHTNSFEAVVSLPINS